MKITRGLLMVTVMMVGTSVATAQAGIVRVPRDAPTIQAAVDRAQDGDVIWIAPGRHCGAVITKEIHLVGSWRAIIAGCPEPSPSLPGGLRIGLLFSGEEASGSSVIGLRFDGAGISTNNLRPLSLAILGRNAHGLTIKLNWIAGTVQGITNTGGDGWEVAANVVHDLTLFDCTTGRCGGGSGIVMQQRNVTAPRAIDNTVALNWISGRIPNGFAVFDMAGVVVYGQDDPIVDLNHVRIPDNRRASARGIGVLVSDVCCGNPAPFLTTHGARITGNDGRSSEFVVVVDRDAGGGTDNTTGAVIRRNRGRSLINGDESRRINSRRKGFPALPFE